MWPRANGEVERQNRSLLRAIRIAHSEGKDWKAEFATFFRAYRTTRHSVTAVPPAEAFLQPKVRCKLTFTSPERLLDDAMRDRDIQNKGKGKDYGDQTARKDDIKVGDTVLLQQPKRNKLSTTYYQTPFEVTDRRGSEVTLTQGDRVLRRHIAHVGKFLHDPQNEMSATRDEEMSGTQDVEDSSQLRQRSALEGKHLNEETDEEDGQVISDGVPDEQHQWISTRLCFVTGKGL